MIIRNTVLPKILRIIAILKVHDFDTYKWFKENLIPRLPQKWIEEGDSSKQ